MPPPWVPVVLSAIAISLTVLSVVAIPLVKALIALNITLTELKEHDKSAASAIQSVLKAQDEFKVAFEAHVDEDQVGFKLAAALASKLQSGMGALHIRVLTIQEKLGLIHHDPPVQVGAEEMT